MRRKLFFILVAVLLLNGKIETALASEPETPEQKVSAIQVRYKSLIETTKSRASDIQKKIQECGNCGEKEIFETQLAANTAYQEYLQAQQLYEECQATPTSCNQQELERRRAASQTKGTQVQGILKNLTELETTRNTERTFDVSDVFTLPGQDVSDRTIRDVVDTVADWMITLASSLAVTALIIGGFMMIISGGDENRLETGKTIFSYSLMGLFVTLMAYGIVTFLQSLFY